MTPSLVLGQRTGLHNLNTVADSALVLFVVCLQANGSLDNLLIQRVFYIIDDSYNDSLIHLIADNQADSGFSQISLSHSKTLLLTAVQTDAVLSLHEQCPF